MVKGMGGAMDLVAGVKRVVVIMEHVAKGDEKKLLHRCTLPLTGAGVVDMVITDLAVFEIDKDGMRLVELAPGVTLAEIAAKTEATYSVAPVLEAALSGRPPPSPAPGCADRRARNSSGRTARNLRAGTRRRAFPPR